MPTFPEMDTFTIAQRVTYHYYLGRILILEDKVEEAREAFQYALEHCHKKASKNINLLLQFLIPINLFYGKSPLPGLIQNHGLDHLQELVTSVKNGNVLCLEQMLERFQDLFISQGLFLTLQNLKLVSYRNLFRSVVLLYQETAPEKMKTRVALNLFIQPFILFGEKSAFKLMNVTDIATSETLVKEQVRCILSNLIFKKYIKGYISHEKEILVISPKDPFPKLNTLVENN